MPKCGCICVFSKPPVAGLVKTRLIPVIGAEDSARLAQAFLLDTWDVVSKTSWAQPVVAASDPLPATCGLPGDAEVWLQGEGDLGRRLERILRKGLARWPFAVAIGADSPGLPSRILERAHAELAIADAVLGPCEDGGFYLLGLRRCPPGLLAGIPWSQADTLLRTRSQLEKAGLKVRLLDSWFDVDGPEDLQKLRDLIAAGRILAPMTARVLQTCKGLGHGLEGVDSDGDSPLPLSVVIPVLNERSQLPVTLQHVKSLGLAHEIIVVDGDSTDGTREWLAGQSGITAISAPRGRGQQLNAGARIATGQILLFLHADCLLPRDAGERLKAALSSSKVADGCFCVRFAQNKPWPLAFVAAGINLRTHITHSATGDQAIFVRRHVFENIGGFRDWPLFEDVDLVRRLKHEGRFVVVPSRATISARRHLKYGVFRTVLFIYFLRLAFRMGISPFVLEKWFREMRPGWRLPADATKEVRNT